MKILETVVTVLVLTFLLLMAGQGCDTQVPPSAQTTTAACVVSEATSASQATDLNALALVLNEAGVPGPLGHVLTTLAPYGLERYTYTFAASQVTYVWWISVEAQDGALQTFCGP